MVELGKEESDMRWSEVKKLLMIYWAVTFIIGFFAQRIDIGNIANQTDRVIGLLMLMAFNIAMVYTIVWLLFRRYGRRTDRLSRERPR